MNLYVQQILEAQCVIAYSGILNIKSLLTCVNKEVGGIYPLVVLNTKSNY